MSGGGARSRELCGADRAALAGNLERLRERLARACQAAGRRPEEVALVAVTKYAGASFAAALLALGQLDLGENRVDHLLALQQALPAGLPAPRWHMVGHLQRNKARKVAGLLSVLHSLDSAELARLLAQHRPPDLPPLRCYLQVALSEADGRSGVTPGELPALRQALTGLTGLELAGLMGLPPQGDEPEQARPHFRRLRELLPAVAPARGLSMGMTADLEVAIEEGATVVRVGQALLEGLSPEARG